MKLTNVALAWTFVLLDLFSSAHPLRRKSMIVNSRDDKGAQEARSTWTAAPDLTRGLKSS